MNDVNSSLVLLEPTIFGSMVEFVALGIVGYAANVISSDFVKVKGSGAVTSGTMTIVYCGCTLFRFNKIRRISGRYGINSSIV